MAYEKGKKGLCKIKMAKMKAKTGQCCELCGRHLSGEVCEYNQGHITCKDEDCIGQGMKADLKKLKGIK